MTDLSHAAEEVQRRKIRAVYRDMMKSVYAVDERRMKDAVLLWKAYDFGWENLNAWQKLLVGTRSSCSG